MTYLKYTIEIPEGQFNSDRALAIAVMNDLVHTLQIVHKTDKVHTAGFFRYPDKEGYYCDMLVYTGSQPPLLTKL